VSERLDTLARDYVRKREAYEKANAEKKRLEEQRNAAQDAFWEALEDQGMKSTTLDLGPGFGEIQFQRRETIKGIVKDPSAAAAAIREEGLADELLGEQKVRQKVLSEYVRDWIASGQSLPEGIDFTPTRYVSITRK
jgi:hypothetical protein